MPPAPNPRPVPDDTIPDDRKPTPIPVSKIDAAAARAIKDYAAGLSKSFGDAATAQYDTATAANTTLATQNKAARSAAFAPVDVILDDTIGGEKWDADKAAKLVDFGSKSYGFTPADFNSIDDPRVVQVLHDAFMYREQQQKPKAAPKPVPEVKPAAKVGGGKPVLKSLDDRMSAADWVKARNAQLSRK